VRPRLRARAPRSARPENSAATPVIICVWVTTRRLCEADEARAEARPWRFGSA
jgi:hypothetical protein